MGIEGEREMLEEKIGERIKGGKVRVERSEILERMWNIGWKKKNRRKILKGKFKKIVEMLSKIKNEIINY